MRYLKVITLLFVLVGALLQCASFESLPSLISNSADENTKKDHNQTTLEEAKLTETPPLNDSTLDLWHKKLDKLAIKAEYEYKKKANDKYRILAWNSKRRANLPIRPPKLKVNNKTELQRSHKIAYGSVVKIRSSNLKESIAYLNDSLISKDLNLSSDSSTSHFNESASSTLSSLKEEPNENPNESNLEKEVSVSTESTKENDILAISSSEHKTSLWAQKQASRQPFIAALLEPLTNPKHSDSSQNSSFFFANLKPKIIPKLLLPKASRPAMYSLNGYIPKPNMQRFTTTTTTKRPMTIRYKKFGVESSVKKPATSEKALIKKKYGSRKYQNVEDTNDLSTSGTSHRRRYSFAKRRGSLTSNSLQSINEKNRFRSKVGIPGQDFPALNSIPKTSFDCKDKSRSGIYVDKETNCQVWHMCQGTRKHSFLCPNGTIFNQKAGICDWWYNVDCSND